LKFVCVSFQVVNDLSPGWISWIFSGVAEKRKFGILFIGMEMKPVVVAVPSGTDLVSLFQNEARNSRPLETGSNGKARGSSPNYHHTAVAGHATYT
jgi:hypothetical protein